MKGLRRRVQRSRVSLVPPVSSEVREKMAVPCESRTATTSKQARRRERERERERVMVRARARVGMRVRVREAERERRGREAEGGHAVSGGGRARGATVRAPFHSVRCA